MVICNRNSHPGQRDVFLPDVRRKSEVLMTEGLCGPGPGPYSPVHALPVPAC
jgi:hypothetical protein